MAIAVCLLILIAPPAFRYTGIPGFVLVATIALGLWLALVIQPRRIPLPFPAIVLIALLLRLSMLAFPPDLSGDVWRYLWDGTVSQHGINPYAMAPSDRDLEPLREPWHDRINHPEIRTIYPPYAQLFFLIARLAGSLTVWRLLLILVDLSVIFALHRQSKRAALLWALCPLAIWEGIWSAHVDLIAGAALLAALMSISRPWFSGVALGVAAGIKIVPLIATPALALGSRRKLSFFTAFALTIITACLPFLGTSFMEGLRDYAEKWSFNGPVYAPLVAMIEALSIDQVIESFWTSVKDPLRLEAISEAVYRQLHPAFLARAVLGCLLIAGIIILVRRSKRLATGVADSVGLLLVLSPTVHPWYWLPVVLIGIVAQRHFWLLLAAASPLSYLLYAEVSPPVVLIISWYVPAVSFLVVRRFRSRRQLRSIESE